MPGSILAFLSVPEDSLLNSTYIPVEHLRKNESKQGCNMTLDDVFFQRRDRTQEFYFHFHFLEIVQQHKGTF